MQKASKFHEIMDNYISKGHVEELPDDQASLSRLIGCDTPISCIPIFSVTNVNKGKQHLVFDRSAKYGRERHQWPRGIITWDSIERS